MSHHPARHLAQGKIDIKKASQVLQGQLPPARLIKETWHHFLHRLHQIELCGLPSRLFGKRQPYLDGIAVTYEADEKISNVFEKFGDEIKTEVLAVSIKSGELKGYEKDWKINGEAVKLAVEKQ